MPAMHEGLEWAVKTFHQEHPGLRLWIPSSDNDSAVVRPLQAADVYAYECGKETVRRLPNDFHWTNSKPARLPLRRLDPSPGYHECYVHDVRAYAQLYLGRIPPRRWPGPLLLRTDTFDPLLIWSGPGSFACFDADTPYSAKLHEERLRDLPDL